MYNLTFFAYHMNLYFIWYAKSSAWSAGKPGLEACRRSLGQVRCKREMDGFSRFQNNAIQAIQRICPFGAAKERCALRKNFVAQLRRYLMCEKTGLSRDFCDNRLKTGLFSSLFSKLSRQKDFACTKFLREKITDHSTIVCGSSPTRWRISPIR